ncbi:MAG TPA: metal-sensitive transcriptional regulator [Acidimicrobiia bacterium]|nr:metal-sensitive transcriptional regulator [Acidimicrobiia bacterium]
MTKSIKVNEYQHGYVDQKADIVKRLRRIEGQVRGLQRLVDEDTYCIDILTQVASTTKALESVAFALLDDHMHHCLVEAAKKGGKESDAKIDEASKAIKRFFRT